MKRPSEKDFQTAFFLPCQDPHVVGRFFRVRKKWKLVNSSSLNPHVVGRFFREWLRIDIQLGDSVLIPMWWGGFSEFIEVQTNKGIIMS